MALSKKFTEGLTVTDVDRALPSVPDAEDQQEPPIGMALADDVSASAERDDDLSVVRVGRRTAKVGKSLNPFERLPMAVSARLAASGLPVSRNSRTLSTSEIASGERRIITWFSAEDGDVHWTYPNSPPRLSLR